MIEIKDSPMLVYGVPISENMKLTEDGFLECYNVPICRTGTMQYAAHELVRDAATVGRAEVITLHRTEAEVFNDATIASFERKPLTELHPTSSVSPRNYKDHTKGFVTNVRRGIGDDADKLLADLIVYDADLIQKIQSKQLREVSCGYECQIVLGDDGNYYQQSIRGNHVAVVPIGRAGHDFAIKDEGSKIKKGLKRKMNFGRNKKNADPTSAVLRQMLTDHSEKVLTMETEDEVQDCIDGLTETLSQFVTIADAKGEKEEEKEVDEEKKEKVMDADTIMAAITDAMPEIVSKSMSEAIAPVNDAITELKGRMETIETKLADAAVEEKTDAGAVLDAKLQEIRQAAFGDEAKVDNTVVNDAAHIAGDDMLKTLEGFVKSELKDDPEKAIKLVDAMGGFLKNNNVEKQLNQIADAANSSGYHNLAQDAKFSDTVSLAEKARQKHEEFMKENYKR